MAIDCPFARSLRPKYAVDDLFVFVMLNIPGFFEHYALQAEEFGRAFRNTMYPGKVPARFADSWVIVGPILFLTVVLHNEPRRGDRLASAT